MTPPLLGLNSVPSGPPEGAVARRRDDGTARDGPMPKASAMRRPRPWLTQPRPREAPGPRSGGIRTAPRGARWTGTGRRRVTPAVPRPRKRGPGACIGRPPGRRDAKPRWSAGGRARRPQGRVPRLPEGRDVRWTPSGAPSPPARRRRKKFSPLRRGTDSGAPAPQTTGALSHVHLTARRPTLRSSEAWNFSVIVVLALA